jgi:hypothetical protein
MAGGHPHGGGTQGPQGPCCSFCGRPPEQTGPLVEGSGPQNRGGAFICRECAELARSIFEQMHQRPPGDTLHDNG